MKKLYLHMGLHKTASSSFQESCKLNKEKLAHQGYVYPIFNTSFLPMRDIVNHSIPIYSLFCEDAKKYYVNKKHGIVDIENMHKDYMKTLESALKEDKNCIISGEDISLLDTNSLRRLKIYFEDNGFEIKPCIVIRSPYSLLCSSKQANIRHGNVSEDSYFNSSIEILKKIQDIFPNILCIPFRKAIQSEKGILSYLFENMKIDGDAFVYTQENTSMPNSVARLLNIVNKSFDRYKENSINPSYMELKDTIFRLEEKNEKKSKKYLLTKEEYNIIKTLCEAENAYLKEHYGEEFCDERIEFSEKDSKIEEFESSIKEACTHGMSEREIVFRYKKAINAYYREYK